MFAGQPILKTLRVLHICEKLLSAMIKKSKNNCIVPLESRLHTADDSLLHALILGCAVPIQIAMRIKLYRRDKI